MAFYSANLIVFIIPEKWWNIYDFGNENVTTPNEWTSNTSIWFESENDIYV